MKMLPPTKIVRYTKKDGDTIVRTKNVLRAPSSDEKVNEGLLVRPFFKCDTRCSTPLFHPFYDRLQG